MVFLFVFVDEVDEPDFLVVCGFCFVLVLVFDGCDFVGSDSLVLEFSFFKKSFPSTVGRSPLFVCWACCAFRALNSSFNSSNFFDALSNLFQ